MSRVEVIDLRLIKESGIALREVNKKSVEYQELVDSVRDRGVLNPITVREQKDGELVYYGVVDGLHRYNAAKDAGLDTIPAHVVSMSDAEVEEAQIIANVHKIETKPVEYTRQINKILSRNPLMTLQDLSKLLTKSTQWVMDRLSLVKLAPSVAKLVDEEKITLTNAYALAKLPEDEQIQFLTAAQTETPSEFCPKVNDRVRQLNAAKRKGKDAEEVKFEPQPFLQKIGDIKQEMHSSEVGTSLIQNFNITTPKEAWDMAIKWVLHLDPVSAQAQIEKENQRRAKLAADKAARQREREEKRAAQARAEQLKAEEAAVA